MNQKQILPKHYNHRNYKNTMLEQNIMEKITKIKILKKKRNLKQ